MPTLFGKPWTRDALLRRIGNVKQIGGAQPVVLDDGPARGVRAIDVRTGSGFHFTILPDRGLDIWTAEYKGASLCWHSPTGPVAPSFFEPEGFGWLRGFYGGMIVTCGLTYAGPPNRDAGKDLGLHGRASYTPASEVGVIESWEGDDYRIEVRGKVREAAVFGENVVMTRRIRTALGENRFVIDDEIENQGSEDTPLMFMYHVNGGFPLLDEDAELLAPTLDPRPRDAEAEKEKEKWARFLPPTAGFAERCYFHRLRKGVTALVNRRVGLGYALRFPLDALPCFCEWKMMGQGLYVVGTEPGNVYPEAREVLRREKRLPTIRPGEKKRFQLEFEVLDSADDIARLEGEIRK